jgi:hypothetical protein
MNCHNFSDPQILVARQLFTALVDFKDRLDDVYCCKAKIILISGPFVDVMSATATPRRWGVSR